MVAYATACFNLCFCAKGIQLLTEEGNIYFHVVIFGLSIDSPYFFKQKGFWNNLSGGREKDFHQMEFFGPQFDGMAVTGKLHSSFIQGNIDVRKNFSPIIAAASGKGADSCKEFCGRKRFGQIIVTARIQSVNDIMRFGFGGEKDDRSKNLFFPQSF